jgi:hypothetical protein
MLTWTIIQFWFCLLINKATTVTMLSIVYHNEWIRFNTMWLQQCIFLHDSYLMHGSAVNSARKCLFQTFTVFWMLYAFFWVIPQRLNFICRHFRTLCLFHLHGQVGACGRKFHLPLPKIQRITGKVSWTRNQLKYVLCSVKKKIQKCVRGYKNNHNSVGHVAQMNGIPTSSSKRHKLLEL